MKLSTRLLISVRTKGEKVEYSKDILLSLKRLSTRTSLSFVKEIELDSLLIEELGQTSSTTIRTTLSSALLVRELKKQYSTNKDKLQDS